MKSFQRIAFVVAGAILIPLAGCGGQDTSRRNLDSFAGNSAGYDGHRYDATRLPDAKFPDPGTYDSRTARWNAQYEHYER